jgi:hypothetical protein
MTKIVITFKEIKPGVMEFNITPEKIGAPTALELAHHRLMLSALDCLAADFCSAGEKSVIVR